MTPTQLESLHSKIDNLELHLSMQDAKEDLLLKMLDQVQKQVETPSVVTPLFPKWATWLFVAFAGLSILSSIVLMGYIFMK